MEVKTFDTILTKLCDDFDSLITPKKISRRNTNVIYLIFKAIAKGFEVVNNVCVVLNNKFDPVTCSEEDLESVANLVGTERLKGSASGLEIIVKNEASDTIPFMEGTYVYKHNDDVSFIFEAPETVYIASGESARYIAFSDSIGSFAVTAQSDITVVPYSRQPMINTLSFACSDNSNLLGTTEETSLEFRERISKDTTRQNSLVELQTALRNLPYIFDAKIFFNNLNEDVTYDDITVPPYHMAIFYSGAPRNEMAQLIASRSIYPTVNVPATVDREGSVALSYESDVFMNGVYSIYVTPFARTEYTAKVYFHGDTTFFSEIAVKNRIKAFLKERFRTNVHSDYITEAELFNALKELDIANIKFLNIDLFYAGSEEVASFISVPKTRLPYLLEVECERVTDV